MQSPKQQQQLLLLQLQHLLQQHKPFPARVPIFMSRLEKTALAVDVVIDVDSALGAAMRRRQRRLRQFLRHERLTVAMALAEKMHHTSRGQKTARAREEEREMHYAMGQTTPSPKAAAVEFCPLTLDAEVGGELGAFALVPGGKKARRWVRTRGRN